MILRTTEANPMKLYSCNTTYELPEYPQHSRDVKPIAKQMTVKNQTFCQEKQTIYPVTKSLQKYVHL